MARRRPRRSDRFITRTEIFAGVGFAVLLVWLALVAFGMGV